MTYYLQITTSLTTNHFEYSTCSFSQLLRSWLLASVHIIMNRQIDYSIYSSVCCNVQSREQTSLGSSYQTKHMLYSKWFSQWWTMVQLKKTMVSASDMCSSEEKWNHSCIHIFTWSRSNCSELSLVIGLLKHFLFKTTESTQLRLYPWHIYILRTHISNLLSKS